jgi:hypothetical protein
MQYSEMQARIAQRCGNRTDLSQIIYDESQDRIQFFQNFFWYSSDVTDTSLVCTPGTAWLDLPNGIRNVKMVRFLLGGLNGLQAQTTAPVTLPAATIPLSSVTNFPLKGTVLILGFPVSYTGISGLNLTGCTGGIDLVPAGTTITYGAGVWLDLEKANYNSVLLADPLSPPNAGPPYAYAQFGTRLRLYLTPDQAYPLEITGNAAPAAPLIDGDDNFWTEDASKLIIAATVLELADTYINWPEPKKTPFRGIVDREKYRLMKATLDLDKPLVVRSYL